MDLDIAAETAELARRHDEFNAECAAKGEEIARRLTAAGARFEMLDEDALLGLL